MSFSIKFNGTGSGLAAKERFQSSFTIYSDASEILVDCGDGISKALAATDQNPCSINKIIITHFHPDHYLGFPFLIVQMKILNRTEPLEILAPRGDIEFLSELLYKSYIFSEKIKFRVDFTPVDENMIFKTGDLTIKFLSNSHLEEYRQYENKEKLSFSSFSLLISDGKKELYYSGDIGSVKDIYNGITDETSVIITETSHVSSSEIKALIESSDKKVYLTHLDYNKETELRKLLGLYPAINHSYVFASDGMTIDL